MENEGTKPIAMPGLSGFSLSWSDIDVTFRRDSLHKPGAVTSSKPKEGHASRQCSWRRPSSIIEQSMLYRLRREGSTCTRPQSRCRSVYCRSCSAKSGAVKRSPRLTCTAVFPLQWTHGGWRVLLCRAKKINFLPSYHTTPCHSRLHVQRALQVETPSRWCPPPPVAPPPVRVDLVLQWPFAPRWVRNVTSYEVCIH